MVTLGFDVGGSSVKHAIVGENGTILEKGKFTTPDNLEKFFAELESTYKNYNKNHEINGVAFSLPGAVDNESGIIGGSSAIDYIHNFDIKVEFEKIFNLPVAMENDANCAALGEVWIGAAKDYDDIAFLVLGSGVGGAIVKNRRIHQGKHFHGGEFGYMVMDDEYHHLSEIASTVNMAKNIAKAKNLPEDKINGEIAFKLANEGDTIAQRELAKMYEYLARAIYNIQYCFDPQLFVIGGAVSVREDLIDNIEKHIAKIMAKITAAKITPKITHCKFGNDANILGAVYNLKTQNFLNI